MGDIGKDEEVRRTAKSHPYWGIFFWGEGEGREKKKRLFFCLVTYV